MRGAIRFPLGWEVYCLGQALRVGPQRLGFSYLNLDQNLSLIIFEAFFLEFLQNQPDIS